MNRKDLLGGILMLFALAILGGGIYAARALKRPRLDETTLCRPQNPPGASTVIVIDRTDPFSPGEQAQVRDMVLAERDLLGNGERITVLLLAAERAAKATALETLVDLCNPGETPDPLIENGRRVRARYQAAFAAPIESALRSLAGETSAPTSPIAASVRTAIEGAGAGEKAPAPKLVLISDLMEHTAAASAYNGTLTGAALRSLLGPQALARLRGAAVSIVLVPRPAAGPRQDAAVGVWRAFFRDATGQEPKLSRLG